MQADSMTDSKTQQQLAACRSLMGKTKRHDSVRAANSTWGMFDSRELNSKRKSGDIFLYMCEYSDLNLH